MSITTEKWYNYDSMLLEFTEKVTNLRKHINSMFNMSPHSSGSEAKTLSVTCSSFDKENTEHTVIEEKTAGSEVAADRRLYAKCFWTLVKYLIEDSGKKQTKLSLIITEGKADNYLSKLMDRNTFPSEEIFRNISVVLPDDRIKKENVLESVLMLPPASQVEAYASYLKVERKQWKKNNLFRETQDALLQVSDDDINCVNKFVLMLVNPHYQSFSKGILQMIEKAWEGIQLMENQSYSH